MRMGARLVFTGVLLAFREVSAASLKTVQSRFEVGSVRCQRPIARRNCELGLKSGLSDTLELPRAMAIIRTLCRTVYTRSGPSVLLCPSVENRHRRLTYRNVSS
jgi:hypothetical protein